jgi:acyl-activating enzyme 14
VCASNPIHQTMARASVARSATRAYARDDDDGGDDNSSRPRVAFVDVDGARRSGTAFIGLVGNAARALEAARGARGEDEDEVVVGIGCETSARFLAHWVATCGMGGTTVPLNSRWEGREARDAARRARCDVVVLDETHRARWWDVEWGGGVVVVRAEEATWPEEGDEVAWEEPTTSGGDADACALVYTSGTTGTPKAAVLTHEGVVSATRAKLEAGLYGDAKTYLHCAPLFHVGGLSSAHATLAAGCGHVFMSKFDPEKMLELIERESVDAFIAVPTMLHMLVEHANATCRGREFTSVRTILVGAGRLREGQLDSVKKMFPQSKITMAYGMTETTSSVTFLDAEDPRLAHDAMFAGNASRYVEVKTDSEGQLLVRGPALMRGYSDVPRSETFDDDGWFATGDLGRVEEVDASSGETGARVWLYGRKKNIIKTGGENVSPEEVERVVNSHEHVAASVVFGASHPKWGEIVCACVELANAAEDEDTAEASIRVHCVDAGLARFKIPKYFMFIPRLQDYANAMGKINRNEFRALAERDAANVK